MPIAQGMTIQICFGQLCGPEEIMRNHVKRFPRTYSYVCATSSREGVVSTSKLGLHVVICGLQPEMNDRERFVQHVPRYHFVYGLTSSGRWLARRFLTSLPRSYSAWRAPQTQKRGFSTTIKFLCTSVVRGSRLEMTGEKICDKPPALLFGMEDAANSEEGVARVS